MISKKSVVLFSVLLGSLLRTVPTVLFFLGAHEVATELLRYALVLAGGVSFGNTARLAVKTYQNMMQLID